MSAQYNKRENDIEAYLAGIRKTIADSNALVAQAELPNREETFLRVACTLLATV